MKPVHASNVQVVRESAPVFVDSLPIHQQPKQGGICCGGCCDYRRAVIVLSSIAILISLLDLRAALRPVDTTDISDDDLRKDIEDMEEEYFPTFVSIAAVAIFMGIVSLCGAVAFNRAMLWCSVAWAVTYFILQVTYGTKILNETMDLLDEYDFDDLTEDEEEYVIRATKLVMITSYVVIGILMVLWVYPTIFLISEIKKGIMSHETYDREMYSCCCM